MADPVAAPKVPPITVPFVDPKTGQINQPWYRYLVGEGGRIGSVNSGVAQARADAAAAQATADAAAQAATDAVSGAGGSPSFYATVNRPLASGARSGPGNVTTTSVTVTPVGGTGPYTYAWTLDSGDTFSINSPTSATTTFTVNITAAGQDKSATYRCTVTDSLAATCSVTVGVLASEIS